MTLICFDLGYARQFLQVPGVSFNVNQMVLMGPLGRGFLEEARAARRRVYLWTVNSPSLMRWAIRHEVDGVITDEPARFRELCEEWEKEDRNESGAFHDPELDRPTVGERLRILVVALYLLLFGWYLKMKYLPSVERVQFEQRKVN
jgi:phosphatidylglycerol phospholipase C